MHTALLEQSLERNETQMVRQSICISFVVVMCIETDKHTHTQTY